MGPFSVTIEPRGGAVLVRPSGELDVMTAPMLEQALARVVSEHRDVLIDLSGVVFADCAGLRPIRRAVERRSGDATSVRIFGAPPRVERVLGLTGLRSMP
jgi:anti-sigma B factor antagonist